MPTGRGSNRGIRATPGAALLRALRCHQFSCCRTGLQMPCHATRGHASERARYNALLTRDFMPWHLVSYGVCLCRSVEEDGKGWGGMVPGSRVNLLACHWEANGTPYHHYHHQLHVKTMTTACEL